MAISYTKNNTRYPAATSPTQEDGLLAPDGTYFPCEYGGHESCARAITDYNYGVWQLEYAEGWIHISGGRVHTPEKPITQAQRDTLFDMFLLNPTSYLADDIDGLIGVRCANEQ